MGLIRKKSATKKTSAKRTQKKTAAPNRRRASTSAVKKGKGRFSGRGRYLILLAAAVLAYKFAVQPAIEKIKANPVFTVRNVTVEGVDYIDPGEIIATAAIAEGSNIFDLDYAGIDSVLERSFAAEDFVVYKRLPDTVAIRIRERQPVAVLNVGELIGVDAEGVPLPHIGANFAESLPVITGVKNVSSLADSTTRNRLMTGLDLMKRISKESPAVYNRISEVNVDSMSKMGITLIDSGLEVIIGSEEWERKMPILEKTIDSINTGLEKVKAVDIRFKERLFIRK